MKTIVMIAVDKLVPHPDNPRKKLGDLTELADSIRAVGIMQNLTVVPFEDKYRILIGHRRCAAAKEAGLTELPCAVVDIPEKDQIEIMLLENMQRSDLTVLEEAQGLQLMMEMGNSIRDICEKTGFSESKVRHRVKMGELDQKVLQKKFEECQNISILDLQKLEQIKTPKLKKKALSQIGTYNFDQAVKNAIDEEEREIWEASILEQICDYVTRTDNTEDKTYLTAINRWEKSSDEKLEKIKSCSGQVYFENRYSTFYFYIDKTQEDIDKENLRKKEEDDLKSRRNMLKETEKRMKELRREFAKSRSNRECGELLFHNEIGLIELVSGMTRGHVSERDTLDFLGITPENPPESWRTNEWQKILKESLDKSNLKKAIFGILYLKKEKEVTDTWDYEAKYSPGTGLQDLYDFLKACGYQMSDEEKQIMDGTHELYTKEEDDE